MKKYEPDIFDTKHKIYDLHLNHQIGVYTAIEVLYKHVVHLENILEKQDATIEKLNKRLRDIEDGNHYD